jgi:hypothetical protein
MKELLYTRSKLFLMLFFLLIMQSSCQLLNSFIEVDEKSLGDNKIEGKMQINGVNYNAICDCNPVSPSKAGPEVQNQGPKCDPSKLRIHSEKIGQGASHDDIRNLVGNIEELNYVKVPNFSFKCLDGRNTDDVMATPGGDAGEFILALTVYEDLVGGGLVLTQDNVDNFFTQYLKVMTHPKFYMCTDDVAIAHLQKDLSVLSFNLDRRHEYTQPQISDHPRAEQTYTHTGKYWRPSFKNDA